MVGLKSFKTLADAKAEFVDSSPEARKAWDATGPRRALSAMLIDARSRNGMSQSDLASVTGWDKGFISRLEGATDGFPSVTTLVRYLAACGERLALSTYRDTPEAGTHVTGFVAISDNADCADEGSPIGARAAISSIGNASS